MSVEKLIAALKAVEDDSTVVAKDWLTNDDEGVPMPESIVTVLSLADGELINSKGGCNFPAHRTLEAAGYPVSCGERDSFGWLTGVIRTNKGNIVYG